MGLKLDWTEVVFDVSILCLNTELEGQYVQIDFVGLVSGWSIVKYFQIGQGIEVFDPSSREMLLIETCDSICGAVRGCVAVYMMLAVCIWISNDRSICNSRSRTQ